MKFEECRRGMIVQHSRLGKGVVTTIDPENVMVTYEAKVQAIYDKNWFMHHPYTLNKVEQS